MEKGDETQGIVTPQPKEPMPIELIWNRIASDMRGTQQRNSDHLWQHFPDLQDDSLECNKTFLA